LVVLCAVLAGEFGVRADEQIRTYTVPKEHHTSDIPVNTAPIQWTLPEGWQQLPSDGIRIGNFAIHVKNGGKAAVAITSFPGEVGTELDNVNRWRSQLGLAPVDEGGVASEPTTVDLSGGKLFDLSGSTARTIVALIRRNGATWFFKLTGDLGAVGDARPAFMEFLKSVRFSAGGDTAIATAASAPVEVAAAAPPATTATDSTSPKWSVPANWVEKAPGPMLFKSFSITDSGASAAVTVSFFPGTVGGVLANVNRWRGQMGLSPVEEGNLAAAVETVETLGEKATLVDFEGTDAKAGQRLVAAIVPHGDNTWFYKLLGDKALVAKEKDSFVNFVKNVQYP
jgi:hypothetical protein